MCGLVAILSPERPVPRERLAAAQSVLRHRGPDGEGTWIGEGVGLAHTRLAIVDPEGGAQPIANEDGSVVVVATGEIYDHERLRRDLEERGHRLRTRSDSELLVHLYEEHGLAFVEHVHGELAFVLWDARKKRLVAARDRFGVRPLVYATHEGALVVASEAKALFAAGVRAAWDAEAFRFAASLQYTPPDRTLFAGVRTLPPGTMLLGERGRLDVRRYWDLDYPEADVHRPTPHDPSAEVLAHLDRAVGLRARAEVPVAFQLSGGLDSTSVLALAARHVPHAREAFTLIFDDPAYDEREVARASAAELGVRLHEVDASRDALADALPGAVVHGEGLVINAHIAAKWLLSRAIARAGFKVALSGEGADEVFGGYAHLRQDLAPGDFARTNAVSVGTMLPDGETLPLDAVRETLGFVPSFLAAKAALGHRVHGLLADPAPASEDPFRTMLGHFDVPGQLRARAPVHASLHLWSRLALATYILRTLGDGMDMAHAVEVRLPFLDTHVFEHARTLPVGQLIHEGTEKHVLRQAVTGIVPEAVRLREKHPLLAPAIATATSGRARELAEDVLGSCRVPFFDARAVQALLARVPSMTPKERIVTEPALMMTLAACVLQDAYRLA